MASISVSGDTSGAVTIAAPAVASTPTLTLPTVSGTFITTGSSGQSIPKAALPTGSVLQVVNATYSTATSSSTNTYVDTGLSATITPTSSTSKILVIVDHSLCNKTTNNNGLQMKLQKNGVDLVTIAPYYGYTGTTGDQYFRAGCTYMDSPATTSALTYKTQFGAYNNLAQVTVQVASTPATITLMEIAA